MSPKMEKISQVQGSRVQAFRVKASRVQTSNHLESKRLDHTSGVQLFQYAF